ncbi:prephenate dehydrogenase/arogenate dehydrogenase family protein [Halorarius halobius]|uniref:prephenate dehydrogenase/arogenate dehydrogenase family protein n=1 Tax=Halorarius halobius TaxID=2962671 RepID=UPI0020CEB1D5|nr:prephenate dehydrogenase/arogenate dehydrogenase family protein [Halorarius halobius]
MRLLVVGAGEMGRWLAESLAPAFDVAVTDVDQAVARDAAAVVDARVADDGETFDAVCFAVPMSAVDDAVAAHADRADRALLDVTGEMTTALDAMRDVAPDRERLSTHPLFAAANAPGNVAVVRDAVGPVTDAVVDALEVAGNEVFETTAAEHDRAMETVQAKAHAAVLAYALAAEDVREEFHTPLSGPLQQLVDQLLDNNPRVYAEIQAAFDGADGVADAARRIADADTETFVDLYEEASR